MSKKVQQEFVATDPHSQPSEGWFAHWRGDLTGGLTAAIVALPLALAFAVASGVDPKAGLYTAIVAGIVAAIFGGSPVQITGPTGAMAVILIGIVAQYGIEKVWLAGVLAGIIQGAMGIDPPSYQLHSRTGQPRQSLTKSTGGGKHQACLSSH